MKVEDLFPKEGRNLKKAKRLIAALRKKAKDSNPEETEDRAGWNAGPHQGHFDSLRMTR